QPLDRLQQLLRDVLAAKGLADRIDPHRARRMLVVGEGERRGLAARGDRRRQAERRELSSITGPVGLAAFRDDDRVLTQRVERARCMPRPAADARRRTGDDVTREWSD